MSNEEGVAVLDQMKRAKSIVNNADRKEKVEEVQGRIERDLELMGITAVEDKLQDEVAQTMENLRAAGVVIWILTGMSF